ncbi:MAG: MATE family efflux transporter [Parvularculaceae bacterium]
MRDLTEGPIPNHILAMAGPIAVGLIVQTLYYIVDLYFVGQLGPEALAGVGAAGNAMFLVIGFTQILSVGTVALVSHAAGRKDQADATLIFNQSVSLAAVFGAATLLLAYGFSDAYLNSVGADEAMINEGRDYIFWIAPGMALQFALAVMGSALRGTGVVKPTMIVQLLSVLSNIILAPILIAGWGTGHPLGVAGAGLATTLSVIVAVIALTLYFRRLEHYVGFHASKLRPRLAVWGRMLAIGLPSGGEFALMFVYMAIIYAIIRDFGSEAQAGFGVGSRVMQSIFLPAMAIAFAAPAVAGQNFGARKPERVRATFRSAILMSSVAMFTLTLLCQIRPELLVGAFSDDAAVVAVSVGFLQIISWNFVCNGVIFTCSGMFQALGNTWPALISTATRIATFAFPALWLSRQPGFTLNHVWYLSIATIAAQAVLSVALLLWQFRKRLPPIAAPTASPA